jgi:hypothetical protein
MDLFAGPVQVVYGAIGREKIHFVAPGAEQVLLDTYVLEKLE